MKHVSVVSREDQAAREALIVGIRRHEFAAGHGGEDRLARNEPAGEPRTAGYGS